MANTGVQQLGQRGNGRIRGRSDSSLVHLSWHFGGQLGWGNKVDALLLVSVPPKVDNRIPSRWKGRRPHLPAPRQWQERLSAEMASRVLASTPSLPPIAFLVCKTIETARLLRRGEPR